MRAVTNRTKAVLLLLLLLVIFPLIAVLPNQVAAVRLAGLSLIWWYAGVVAPCLGALASLAWLPDASPPASSASGK